MSLQVEKLEKNMAKLTIEVPVKSWKLQLRRLIRKIREKFRFPVSVRAKCPAR